MFWAEYKFFEKVKGRLSGAHAYETRLAKQTRGSSLW